MENQVGVLSKISGLFSGKSYNLDRLTVGTTEDPTLSRITIGTFKAQVINYGKDSLLLEFFQTSVKNGSLVRLMKKEFHHIEVVRGGSVSIESISMTDR